MLLQLNGVALARNTDHKSKISIRAGLYPGNGILDDNRPPRLGSENLAAIKNESGAGFPASPSDSIVFPSTRTSKKSSNLAAFKTAVQF